MKLLVIDDHPVVLHALVALLRNSNPELTVLHAPDTEAGLATMQEVPDIALLLLDLGLPGLSGTAAIDRFRQAHPALKIVVVSASESPHDVRRAIAHGARGLRAEIVPAADAAVGPATGDRGRDLCAAADPGPVRRRPPSAGPTARGRSWTR